MSQVPMIKKMGTPMPPRKFKLCQNMRILLWHKVPPEWTAIVTEVLDEVLQMKMSSLGANDIFAGTKNMQAKWKEKGIPCSKFELDDDPDENCLSPIGVKIFVRDTLRMVPNSISTMGPPCKFWIFLTLSHTKRTKDNVLGSPNSWMAVEGNKIAQFVAKGIRLVDAVSCYSLIEQPTNSLFFLHPDVKQALLDVGHNVAKFNMEKFGHESQKATQIHGTAPWIPKLHEIAKNRMRDPTKPRKRLSVVDANGAVTGKKGALKSSAAYTDDFCNVVQECHITYMKEVGNYKQGIHEIKCGAPLVYCRKCFSDCIVVQMITDFLF